MNVYSGFLLLYGFAQEKDRKLKKAKKRPAVLLILIYGAEGGDRTHTVLPPRDFESRTSTNSITSADLNIIT